MRYGAEDYLDIMFDDFKIRQRMIQIASGERITDDEPEKVVTLSPNDPGQLCILPYIPGDPGSQQCYYGVPGRAAFDKKGKKTLVDLIADTPNTVLRK